MSNKLSLKTESIRVLQSDELEVAAGGRHHHHRLPSFLRKTTTFGPPPTPPVRRTGFPFPTVLPNSRA